MESVLRAEIRNYLNRLKLIIDSQNGFIEEWSCLTNLLLFWGDVTRAIDNGYPLDTIYLDFSKAFENVSHLGLCKKIEACGIPRNIKKWIQNWFSNRMQRVVLNGIASSEQLVKCDVPQGSMLRPILFVTFINDSDTIIQSKQKRNLQLTLKCTEYLKPKRTVKLYRKMLKTFVNGVLIGKCCSMSKM